AGAVRPAAAGARTVRRAVARLARLVHRVVAARRRRRAGAVRPAAARARSVRRAVARLARLVDRVVPASRRRGTRAVGPAAAWARAVSRAVALLLRAVHLTVAAERDGESEGGERHLRLAGGRFLRVVLDVVGRCRIEGEAVDAVAADRR